MGQLMTEHARQIFKQKQEVHKGQEELKIKLAAERAAEKERRMAAGESVEDIEGEGLIYVCAWDRGATIRDGMLMSANKIGNVKLGTRVVCLEEVESEGHTRMRINNHDHWVSISNPKKDTLFSKWGAGLTFEVVTTGAKIRDGLATTSKEIGTAKVGSHLVGIEARKAHGHQRLMIDAAGHWISVITANNRTLLKEVSKAPGTPRGAIKRRLSITSLASPRAAVSSALLDTAPSLVSSQDRSQDQQQSTEASGVGLGPEEGVPPQEPVS